ncbi:MAG: response regulator [Desulfobacterales bacterium]|jgi:putative nucleotidyltransferase with HDIG domain|nr:response regulator [Desulfobacterales bacterium]
MTDPRPGAVLFVDDEPLLLQGLQRMLRSQRGVWKMRFAGSGREALELLAHETVDALVTDLRMPGMSGEELLREVQARHPQVVRIILSGEMDSAASFTAVQCAHRYLAKPCAAEELKAALAQALSLRGWVETHPLKGLLARIESLPSLPEVYAKLLAEIQSPRSCLRRVGQLLERDVGMTAKILQIVNSAFFGLPRRVVNVQDAVALLGLDTLKALVLSTKIFSQFDSRRMRGLNLEALWQHSMQAGVFARTIAASEKLPRASQDEAFTAGMLHDIGKLVLAQNFPQECEEVAAQASAGDLPAAEIELARFGASHAELGAYLLGLWGIGEAVVDAIARHHRALQGTGGQELAAAVCGANELEHMLAGAPGATAVAGWAGSGHGCPGELLGRWAPVCRSLHMQEGADV